MNGFLVAVFGFLSGIAGGMGMGGGTFLIPLLLRLGIPQHAAQAANLISFLPMCAASLVIHAKNGLLKTSGTGWTVLVALIGSAIGAVFAQSTPPSALRKCFGVLLVLFGIYQLVLALRAGKKKPFGSVKEE